MFVIDDKQTIDRIPPGGMLSNGTPSDFARGTLTLDLLEQLARAGRITGQTLGVSFVLRDSQRKALAAFYDRVSGRKPRTATSEALATEHPRRIGVTTVRSGR